MKIFSMVKNEVDIVRAWVKYHASLVGLQNLIVLDNHSTDGTREALAQLNVAVRNAPDYRKKGDYMTDLARNAPNELVIPMDIDEFLVLYDRETNSISCNVLSTLVGLPAHPVYKMNYINVKQLAEYSTAPAQATRGTYANYGPLAKSFFHTSKFTGQIDHGNHFPTQNYMPTPLCLVHYHYRNRNQYFEKIRSNVEGLGYPMHDLRGLKLLLEKQCKGSHHVSAQISILEGTFCRAPAVPEEGDIDLTPLVRKILSL
jgi:hypothetical protein